jgi:hypothetical protein
LGSVAALAALGSCAIDESGTGDGSFPDVAFDVSIEAGLDADAVEDVTYDVPDLGTGETDTGAPCTCVTSVPSGYTVVEYVPDQRPGCTTGYSASKDYVENPTAAASTCSCTCGTTPTQAPTCSCGNPASFNVSSGKTDCTTVPDAGTLLASTNCYKTPQTITATGGNLAEMGVSPPTACTASGGNCGAPSKTATFPKASASSGRACNLQDSIGTCSGGVCVPSQGAPFDLCVTNLTMDACPTADFPYSHVVGDGIADTRSCGPDSCGCSIVNVGTCGTPQVELWLTSGNCSGPPSQTLPADGTTCTPVAYGNTATFNSTAYTVSQSGGACGFSGTYAPTGSLGVTNQVRICCHSQ